MADVRHQHGLGLVGAAVAFALDYALPGMRGLILAASISIAVTAIMLFSVDRALNLGLAGILARVFPEATAMRLCPPGPEGSG